MRIKARPEAVYRALTSATELCRWWLQGAETDARNAGRFRMIWPKVMCDRGTNGDGRSARVFPPHVAVGDSEGYFVDLEPGRKVAWMWKPQRRSVVPPLSSFFIAPHGRGCEVTLLHGGFPSRSGADRYYSGCAQGWEDCLAKLKLYLETGRTCKSSVLKFSALKAAARSSR
ncbi:MAG: SRPBCC domain-containing protein [Elusimicrobia bacterium]|nr:SRPBCC domain-containing protein [Elusimicrobiota bacterium]